MKKIKTEFLILVPSLQIGDVIQIRGMSMQDTATVVALPSNLVGEMKGIVPWIPTACLGWCVETTTVLRTLDSVIERTAASHFRMYTNQVNIHNLYIVL